MFRIALFPIITLFIGMYWPVENSTYESKNAVYPDYPEHLPGAFTGGFGEESCHSCHFDYPLNPESGSISVEGIPDIFEAGKTYALTISVKREKLGQAGFQISSRFDDGSQAGSFDATSEDLQFTDVKSQVQYLEHSLKGSRVNNQASKSWEVNWTAPDSTSQNIILNIAANAGNGDASAFGDFIFVRELEMQNEPE